MRLPAIAFALLALCACSARMAAVEPSAEAAVAERQVYVIRHLQKGTGDDPSLTAEGSANAQKLAAILADKKIVTIFATPTRRAMETAAPLASQLGLAVTPYDPRAPQALVAAVAAAPGPVLVVGHSNTVPDLVAAFGGEKPEPLTDEDYGTLFVVGSDGKVTTVAVR